MSPSAAATPSDNLATARPSVKARIGLHHQRRLLALHLIDRDPRQRQCLCRLGRCQLAAQHQRKVAQLALREEHAQSLLLIGRSQRPLALDRTLCRTPVQPHVVDRQIGRHHQRHGIDRATLGATALHSPASARFPTSAAASGPRPTDAMRAASAPGPTGTACGQNDRLETVGYPTGFPRDRARSRPPLPRPYTVRPAESVTRTSSNGLRRTAKRPSCSTASPTCTTGASRAASSPCPTAPCRDRYNVSDCASRAPATARPAAGRPAHPSRARSRPRPAPRQNLPAVRS